MVIQHRAQATSRERDPPPCIAVIGSINVVAAELDR